MWRRMRCDLQDFAEDASPLGGWWNASASFDDDLRADIIEMLEAVHFPSEPRWAAAASGDAASSVNLAIRVLVLEERQLALYRDVILIALWRCAADGDVTAKVVMDWLGLRRKALSGKVYSGRTGEVVR